MFGVVGSTMRGWYGSGGSYQRYTNILPSVPEPPIFNPYNDLSDCVLWLDANDSSTIEVNTDTSGNNVNRVMKWYNKATKVNNDYYHHHGAPSTSGLYNMHTMNFLNTVYFEPNAHMSHRAGGVVYPFQARTFFAVIKPLTNLVDASGAVQPFINIYNGFDPGAMNTGFTYDISSGMHSYTMCENGITCGVVWDLSNNPVNQRMILMFAQTDALDLSGNAGSYDTIYQPLTFSDPADSYDTTSTIQYYLNDSVKQTAQDIAEIIMYGRCLTEPEQIRVLEYLADKWNLSGANNNILPGGRIEVAAPAPAPAPAPPAEWYPLYGYAIYTQFPPDAPNFYWCDEFGNTENPPVLIINYDGSTGERDSQTYNILGTIYP